MPGRLKILSSMAPRDVLAAAAVQYGERHDTRIDRQAAGGVEVARRVSEGEAVDVVVLARDAIDKLIGGGKLLAEGRADLMTSAIAIAVRTGTAHPDVTDEASVRQAVLGAASVGFSTGPSGSYLEKLFERWGILAALRERIVVPPPGVPVAQLIAAGEVALGFQQLSELLNLPQVDVVGTLPAAIQHTTTFTAGISPTCAGFQLASDFVAFLASPATEPAKLRHGMSGLAKA